MTWTVAYGDPNTKLGKLTNKQSQELLSEMIKNARRTHRTNR